MSVLVRILILFHETHDIVMHYIVLGANSRGAYISRMKNLGVYII